jgi:hypothetical protein
MIPFGKHLRSGVEEAFSDACNSAEFPEKHLVNPTESRFFDFSD